VPNGRVSDLTVLCVTAGREYAWPFVEEMEQLGRDLQAPFVIYDGLEAGYLEACLDRAVRGCADGYILRLDDDERVSHEMWVWLMERRYRTAEHWSFPRANLYPDDRHRLGGRFWPDFQTRLSVKALSGGRHRIHTGSPFGAGQVAPVVIEHHKLLVRSLEERQAQAAWYDRIKAGAGTSLTYGPLQTPELFDVEVVPYETLVAA